MRLFLDETHARGAQIRDVTRTYTLGFWRGECLYRRSLGVWLFWYSDGEYSIPWKRTYPVGPLDWCQRSVPLFVNVLGVYPFLSSALTISTVYVVVVLRINPIRFEPLFATSSLPWSFWTSEWSRSPCQTGVKKKLWWNCSLLNCMPGKTTMFFCLSIKGSTYELQKILNNKRPKDEVCPLLGGWEWGAWQTPSGGQTPNCVKLLRWQFFYFLCSSISFRIA